MKGSFITLSLGQQGSDYFVDAGGHTGPTDGWGIITALEATAIASLTSSTMLGTLTDIPLPAGTSLFGIFSEITLTSGKVVCYRI